MGAAGRRGELKRDRTPEARAGHTDDDTDGPEVIDDVETWSDHWSEELVDAYHTLLDQCNAYGYAFLEQCSFPDFVDFAFQHSSKRYPPT